MQIIENIETAHQAIANNEHHDNPEGYCIKHDPRVCGCRVWLPWEFAHVEEGFIIVWPEKDAEEILEVANYIQRVQKVNPRIIEYEEEMGRGIEWDKV